MVKKKLLIVDDEPDILQLLEKRFKKNNFDVLTADNGQKCLDIASQEQPDLIILDIIMPFLDGYEVIEKLRTNLKTKQIPIIMHSVKKESRSIFKSLDLGSIDYVINPASFDDLLKVVNRYV